MCFHSWLRQCDQHCQVHGIPRPDAYRFSVFLLCFSFNIDRDIYLAKETVFVVCVFGVCCVYCVFLLCVCLIDRSAIEKIENQKKCWAQLERTGYRDGKSFSFSFLW